MKDDELILIRADANEIIGTGHVMRCLSLAQAFSEKGKDVIFVTADHRGDGLIKNVGFETICLESDWTAMDEENIESVCKDLKPDLIVIDSYYVTKDYCSRVSSMSKTAFFDDMNADCWDVDFLINYNIFSSILSYNWYDDKSTKLLLGTKFAPLRSEFSDLDPHGINDDVTSVLVSAGGADPEKITIKLMEKLCQIWDGISFHFIVGALNPNLDDIRRMAPSNAVLHVDERNMSGLMQDCDIAISAAGTTLYELCATGIPTITYTLADNQLIAAEEFDRQGVMINAGDCRGNGSFADEVNNALCMLAEDADKRREMSDKMKLLVDGSGAERLAAELIEGIR